MVMYRGRESWEGNVGENYSFNLIFMCTRGRRETRDSAAEVQRSILRKRWIGKMELLRNVNVNEASASNVISPQAYNYRLGIT